MILLETANKGVVDLLMSRFEAAKAGQKCELMDFTIADFDGGIYHVSSAPDQKNIIYVSIRLKFYKDLQQYGADQYLRRCYGSFLANTPEREYCATLVYDLDNLPADYAAQAEKAGLLRRNCFAAVFDTFFEFQAKADPKGSQRAIIHYRDDETMYVQAMSDRVTVIFSTFFKDPDDVIIGKVFMQELAETRRRGFNRAPQVIYSYRTPPQELANTDAAQDDNVAYITFVLFPYHTSPENREKSIDLIHTLRNYLHYHIKCSKAHIHMRMRAKCSEWLKVLNRARPEFVSGNQISIDGTSAEDKGDSRRTYTGRSFRPH